MASAPSVGKTVRRVLEVLGNSEEVQEAAHELAENEHKHKDIKITRDGDPAEVVQHPPPRPASPMQGVVIHNDPGDEKKAPGVIQGLPPVPPAHRKRSLQTTLNFRKVKHHQGMPGRYRRSRYAPRRRRRFSTRLVSFGRGRRRFRRTYYRR